MKMAPPPAPKDDGEEIFALVETLNRTEQRLEELTAGQVDSVVDRQGKTFFLRRAQEELRSSESVKQAAILNALPAQIALLDSQGIIVSVNESWRRFGIINALQSPGFGVGQNYLGICEGVIGDCSEEALTAAKGIRQVLQGKEKEFALEYPCHSLNEKCWFRLVVTPVNSDHLAGAVVMHVNITERMLAEEQLRSKTALLEAQLNSTLDGIIILDSEGKLVLQNQKMNDLWNPPQDIFDEIDHRKRLQWVAGQVANPQQFSERVAYLYDHPNEIGRDELELTNGKIFDRYIAPVISRDGKHLGRIWAYRDITERKRAAQELEELSRRTERRERLLNTALASMSDFAQIYDQAGRLLFVNQPLLDLWGLTLEEVVGKNFVDLGYPQELAEKLQRELQGVFATRQKLTAETSYTSPAGVIGHYEYIFSPALNSDGAVDFVVGATRDITERKKSEARFRLLVDSNVQGVLFWNRDGRVTSANDAFLRIIGYSQQELESGEVSWMTLTPPEYAHLDHRALETIATTGTCAPYEKEYIRKDGSRVPILLGSACFEDNPDEGVCFVVDLTERKKLEHQFLRAQRMESIGTLAGGIAHDLNNALAPIMMSIDMLRMKFADQESQELLATLSSSAHRGADMVRQVLSFARGVEGRHMEVQVGHVIKDVEKIAKDTFLKNIQVRSIIGRDPWTIMGDPTQVHQVLLNLCVNARDAMPEGGILTLSAENVQVDEHYAGLVAEAQSGSYLLLQVEDTGSGMPPGVIEKIFDPFFTTKEVGKGTGLGLSTSLAIVKSHGGFMRVYSEMGKGTKFKVYFPAQTEASSGTAEEIAAEMPRGNGEIILVVDDEASVRQITRQTLQAFGYRVILASDGVEALSIFARQGPEIAAVLTDMMMPVMDGPALVRVLRKMKPTLPVIGAGGLSAPQDISGSGSLGLDHFLPKPYMASELLKVLREILSTKK